MIIDYDYLKEYARINGQRVTDMIALAPANDPFYTGTPTERKVGAWFAQLWRKFGYSGHVHIRRVHYQIISQSPPVQLPEGMSVKHGEGRTTTYLNTEECWDFLNAASKAARYLGLVDPAAFVDRRNPEPQIYAPYDPDEPAISTDASLGSWETEIPSMPRLPDYYLENFRRAQDYQIEIWCEKSTMNDVLVPLCQQYGANLVTGLGELSITATLQCLRRIEARGKPTRIFYISDFDPAGQSMPVAVSRKIEYFVRTEQSDVDIRLFPVVMTAEQIEHYNLPRTPIKSTERRRESFELRHGTGAVELDALEALYPGELARLIIAYIERYYDPTLDDRSSQAEQELRRDLREARARALEPHQDEIDAVTTEYDKIRAEFEERMSKLRERMAQLFTDIGQSLEDEMPDIDMYPLPDPREAIEVGSGLFNTERDYHDQLYAYKRFQGKD